MEDLVTPSYDDQLLIRIHSIQVRPSWMDPLVSFIKEGLLLEDKGEVKKICRKAPQYWLFKEQKLYKRPH